MALKKMGNIILWVLVVIAVLAAAYSIYNKNRLLSTSKEPPRVEATTTKAQNTEEKPKAPDFSLKDLNGKTVKLSDYKGKVVILNFWATWCPYCIDEMPDLDKLSKEYSKSGETVILAIDVQEDAKKVEKFVSDNKFSLPVLLDTDGSVASAYGISGYPTTFIINKDGTVYGYIPRATDAETLSGVVDKIK